MPAKSAISACLIVYNEENVIKRCLDSIKGVVDEIIVVHDGECRDATLDICRQYTDKVFVLPHRGEVTYNLPFAFSKASGPWILKIDADEFLSKKLADELRLLVDKPYDGFRFIWPFWDGYQAVTRKWPYKLALFKKDKISFLVIPHYSIDVNGPIANVDLVLEHQPAYNNFTWRSFKDKWIRTAHLHAIEYTKPFYEIEKYNYQGTDWKNSIKLRRMFTIFMVPLDFIRAWLLLLQAEINWVTIKYFFFLSLYTAYIDVLLFKYKFKKPL